MTMTNDNPLDESTMAFWLTHPDPTQASVHLALQWLAHVYPASEKQIDRILNSALPYADSALSARWAQFLEQQDVEGHIDALTWIADTLSEQQIPFLIDTCWRLLLVDHEFPTQVPLALRIIGRIVDFEDSQQMVIGAAVFNEYAEDDLERPRAPLVPIDPRYLDRVEWRLYGHSATHRRTSYPVVNQADKNRGGLYGFIGGTVFGALLVGGLVFGPLQMGRLQVPTMSHDGLLADAQPASSAPAPVEMVSPKLVTTPEPVYSAILPADMASPAAVATESAPADIPTAPIGLTNIASAPIEQEPTAPTEMRAERVGDVVAPGEAVLEPVTMVVVESPAPAPAPAPPVIEAIPLAVTEQLGVVTIDPLAERARPAVTPSAQWLGSRVLMEVTATILNVRREPLVDSPVLIKLATNARVWAYPGQVGGQWMAVKVEGETGYASARFLAEVDLP